MFTKSARDAQIERSIEERKFACLICLEKPGAVTVNHEVNAAYSRFKDRRYRLQSDSRFRWDRPRAPKRRLDYHYCASRDPPLSAEPVSSAPERDDTSVIGIRNTKLHDQRCLVPAAFIDVRVILE